MVVPLRTNATWWKTPSLIGRPAEIAFWSFPAVSEQISASSRPGPLHGGVLPIRIAHMLESPQVGHFSITDSCRVEVVRIQKSIVKSFVSKLPTVLPKEI